MWPPRAGRTPCSCCAGPSWSRPTGTRRRAGRSRPPTPPRPRPNRRNWTPSRPSSPPRPPSSNRPRNAPRYWANEIRPSSGSTRHASEWPGSRGSANLIYRLLDIVAADLDTWSRTAIFINIDENDGYIDHVPPPVPPPGGD
ncbi:alkaline phosphatase family protein, partial [Nocardia wallacei]|uniref:alkaline phosphatase family protein n=1 Tax=Nocardia wallacei TaxID=480035 RepID=UPI002457970A